MTKQRLQPGDADRATIGGFLGAILGTVVGAIAGGVIAANWVQARPDPGTVSPLWLIKVLIGGVVAALVGLLVGIYTGAYVGLILDANERRRRRT